MTKEEILGTVLEGNSFKTGMSKRISADSLYRRGNGNLGEIVRCVIVIVISKCKRTDALKSRYTVKGNGSKLGAFEECIVADGLYGRGNNEIFDICILTECVVTDGLKYRALNGEDRISEVVSIAIPPVLFNVTAEAVFTDRLNGCGNSYVNVCSAPEGVSTKLGNALVKNDSICRCHIECTVTDRNGVIGKSESAKLCISKCVACNNKCAVSIAYKLDLGNGSVIECILANVVNIVCNGHLGEVSCILEYTVVNGCNG